MQIVQPVRFAVRSKSLYTKAFQANLRPQRTKARFFTQLFTSPLILVLNTQHIRH